MGRTLPPNVEAALQEYIKARKDEERLGKALFFDNVTVEEWYEAFKARRSAYRAFCYQAYMSMPTQDARALCDPYRPWKEAK